MSSRSDRVCLSPWYSAQESRFLLQIQMSNGASMHVCVCVCIFVYLNETKTRMLTMPQREQRQAIDYNDDDDDIGSSNSGGSSNERVECEHSINYHGLLGKSSMCTFGGVLFAFLVLVN